MTTDKTRLSVDLSPIMFEALGERAKEAGQTKAAVVRSVLCVELKEHMRDAAKKKSSQDVSNS